jgi:outer membrane immunogenic protein
LQTGGFTATITHDVQFLRSGGYMFRKIVAATALIVSCGGVALAADLPSRAPPPVYVPPPAFTWTGFYVGGEVGYQFGHVSTSLFTNPGLAPLGGLPGYNTNGVVGGAHAGLRAQMGQFVVGVEADIEGAGVRGSNTLGATPGGGGPLTYSTREDVESTYRLTAGYAIDRVLIYGTGGLAIADFNNSYSVPGVAGTTDSFFHTRFGWTGGAGVEYAFDNHWSARVEYRFTDFGSTNDFLVNSIPADAAHIRETDNSVRVGFSYKIYDDAKPAPPVIAKY